MPDVHDTPSAGRCPTCGHIIRGQPPETTRCQACGSVLSGSGRASRGVVCPICQCPIGPAETSTTCPECRTVAHQDCWDYNGGCGLYGCARAPRPEGLDALEIPVSYWGQDRKTCPVCDGTILAAALRCRHCGATFQSARPEDHAAYVERARLATDEESARRKSIWLLVFALLPCTAPIAAVVGLAWYFPRRETVRALPGVTRAMCQIAMLVAVVQTVLAVVLAVLYHMVQD
jgi:hypothetical protein